MLLLNPLLGRKLPDDPQLADREVRRLLVPRARGYLDLFDDPSLLPEDRFGLTIIAVTRESQEALWPIGVAITREMVERSVIVGIRTLLDAIEAPEPRWRLVTAVGNRQELWCWRADGSERRSLNYMGSPYDDALAGALMFARDECGPRRDFKQFRGVMKSVAFILGLHEADEEVSDRMASGYLAVYRQSTFGEPGGIFRDKRGNVVIGAHQLRDKTCTLLGVRRPPRTKKATAATVDDCAPAVHGEQIVPSVRPKTVRLASDPEDAEAAEAVKMVDVLDVERVARAWVDARRLAANPATVEEDVMPYLLAVMKEEMTASDVARLTGRAMSAVHTKLHQLADALRNDLGRAQRIAG
jgi:hypothetical protein